MDDADRVLPIFVVDVKMKVGAIVATCLSEHILFDSRVEYCEVRGWRVVSAGKSRVRIRFL